MEMSLSKYTKGAIFVFQKLHLNFDISTRESRVCSKEHLTAPQKCGVRLAPEIPGADVSAKLHPRPDRREG